MTKPVPPQFDTLDVVTAPLDRIVDPENFTPRLVSILSNALVSRESAELRSRFSLGTNEWRVLSALATKPGATAKDVSEFLVLNPALISRSVSTLVARSLIVLSDGPRGSRPMYLTAAGAALHDEMLPVSLRGQEIVLAEFRPDEVELLNSLLRRMLRQAPALQSVDRHVEAGT
ncbi:MULTISPECIES: MarR family winged helix-turn-helix transcriptional regulator [Microbacterium]|jgi:DNA-binding MarR family transcriptional regulator|uniref:MarR family winged helix-turn-helix transcriptional regulator n=1 Tax=Microbacterium TaxID=33882 RepID=UPI0023DC7CFF|nr:MULTISPECIES: MarR family winged helix-turn-helix transcriptional regulator [Microbacterium]MDF2048156.1 MarR family winged helix-turn-helix transcriptional regulator [Microbacterium sp. Kw_RZR3]MDF2916428.1 hypothetical protein [Microbacterium sp.]MDQ1075504.1 DNA-binding MarR family transcriptional regulator [Microbacterium sp. SORGH_AS_0969]MDQ1115742.1 DNA-binding MarR family transcriptional regulator [Microbacterium testaceum]